MGYSWTRKISYNIYIDIQKYYFLKLAADIMIIVADATKDYEFEKY